MSTDVCFQSWAPATAVATTWQCFQAKIWLPATLFCCYKRRVKFVMTMRAYNLRFLCVTESLTRCYTLSRCCCREAKHCGIPTYVCFTQPNNKSIYSCSCWALYSNWKDPTELYTVHCAVGAVYTAEKCIKKVG